MEKVTILPKWHLSSHHPAYVDCENIDFPIKKSVFVSQLRHFLNSVTLKSLHLKELPILLLSNEDDVFGLFEE